MHIAQSYDPSGLRHERLSDSPFVLCIIVEDLTGRCWSSEKMLCRGCFSEGEVTFLPMIILPRFCLYLIQNQKDTARNGHSLID